MNENAPHLESTLEGVAAAVGYHHWLASVVAPHLDPPVLEIGAGLGTFTAAMIEHLHPVFASEIDQSLDHKLYARFDGDARVQVTPSLSLPLRRRLTLPVNPRAVVLANVLEHVPDDAEALRSIRDCVMGTERIAIVVPAHRWAYSSLDRVLGHYRRYTKADLRTTIEAAGLVCVSIRYFNPLGALAWAVSGRLFGRRTITTAQARWVERILPLLKAADWIMGGRGFGQSLIAIVRPAGG